jgi:ABC-type Fe3+/spermidine/putrescine transport system ATPase subunit
VPAELGDRVALMLEGRVVQHAEPRELFERPATAAVARFFGMTNVLRGEVCDGRLDVAGVGVPVPGPDGPATLGIRPEHVVLGHTGALVATVLEAVYAGTHVRLVLRAGKQHLEAHAAGGDVPPTGARVRVELPRARLWRFAPAPAAPGRRAGRR